MDNNGSSENTAVAIAKLREAVLDLKCEEERINDDLYLLRWLKARSMCPESAERMLRRSLNWRERMDFKNLRERKFAPELVEAISLIQTFCRTGQPIYFMNPHINLKQLLDKFPVDETYGRFWQALKEAEVFNIQWNSGEFGKNPHPITANSIQGNIAVLDWKYVTFSQVSSVKCFQIVKQLAIDFLKYCPALGDSITLINCPKIALHLVNMFKPMVSGYLSVEVYGGDPDTWKKVLLEKIHPDQLPIQYGGNLKNPWMGGK